MKIDGTYTFNASREEIWESMLDPEVLSRTLPGVQELEKIGENQYKAKMKIRIGPVQGLFMGTVNLSQLQPPVSCHLEVDGKGAPGFVKGEGDLELEEQGDTTLMKYSGDVQVGGRLASVGQRLMESSTQALIRQSLESLETQVQARQEGLDPDEVASLEAPSEAAFAAGVTLKMLDDMVPPEQRRDLMRAGLTLMVVLFALRALSKWWIDQIASRVADVLDERDRNRP